MSDGMIERVARAISLSMVSGKGNPFICARAAIAAMHDPTEAMMRAADNEGSMDIWHDMIEAALDG